MRQICSKKTNRDYLNLEYYIVEKTKKKNISTKSISKTSLYIFKFFSVLTSMHEIKEQKKIVQ